MTYNVSFCGKCLFTIVCQSLNAAFRQLVFLFLHFFYIFGENIVQPLTKIVMLVRDNLCEMPAIQDKALFQ